MTNNYIIPLIISFVYLIFKFLDMRYLKKENKGLKDLILDSFIVFLSSLLGFVIYNQFNLLEESGNITKAFTDNPTF